MKASARWRVSWSWLLAACLAACGGGGGSDAAPPGPPNAQHPSGPKEFAQCLPPPNAVRIARELDEGRWRTNRYVAYAAGDPLGKMVAAPGVPTAKNPEGVLAHGPLQAQNCTQGATGGTQWMRMKVRTRNYMDTGIVDHLVFGLRAGYPTLNREGEEAYDAIGVIFSPGWGGAMAERFGRPGGNDVQAPDGAQVSMRDGQTYTVEMEARDTQVRWRVRAEGAGDTGWSTYTQPLRFAPVSGSGYMIAVLCRDRNASCEAFDQEFSVDVSEIESGWF